MASLDEAAADIVIALLALFCIASAILTIILWRVSFENPGIISRSFIGVGKPRIRADSDTEIDVQTGAATAAGDTPAATSGADAAGSTKRGWLDRFLRRRQQSSAAIKPAPASPTSAAVAINVAGPSSVSSRSANGNGNGAVVAAAGPAATGDLPETKSKLHQAPRRRVSNARSDATAPLAEASGAGNNGGANNGASNNATGLVQIGSDGMPIIPAQTWEVQASKLKLKYAIGKGNFGEVWLATFHGTPVAVKTILPALQSNEKLVKRFLQEIELMSGLHHPNVVLFLGACTKRPNLCLVLEYCVHGSLHHFLKASHEHGIQITLSLILRFALDIARGVYYLHRRCSVVQRDLKARNILVDGSLNAKVADFGLSRVLDEQEANKLTACGTPAWTAPEIVKMEAYTDKVDVYSFGIIMWELLTREEPYGGQKGVQIAYAAAEQGLRPEIPSFCPPDYALLMRQCWADDPNDRPSFAQILKRLFQMKKAVDTDAARALRDDHNNNGGSGLGGGSTGRHPALEPLPRYTPSNVGGAMIEPKKGAVPTADAVATQHHHHPSITVTTSTAGVVDGAGAGGGAGAGAHSKWTAPVPNPDQQQQQQQQQRLPPSSRSSRSAAPAGDAGDNINRAPSSAAPRNAENGISAVPVAQQRQQHDGGAAVAGQNGGFASPSSTSTNSTPTPDPAAAAAAAIAMSNSRNNSAGTRMAPNAATAASQQGDQRQAQQQQAISITVPPQQQQRQPDAAAPQSTATTSTSNRPSTGLDVDDVVERPILATSTAATSVTTPMITPNPNSGGAGDGSPFAVVFTSNRTIQNNSVSVHINNSSSNNNTPIDGGGGAPGGGGSGTSAQQQQRADSISSAFAGRQLPRTASERSTAAMAARDLVDRGIADVRIRRTGIAGVDTGTNNSSGNNYRGNGGGSGVIVGVPEGSPSSFATRAAAGNAAAANAAGGGRSGPDHATSTAAATDAAATAAAAAVGAIMDGGLSPMSPSSGSVLLLPPGQAEWDGSVDSDDEGLGDLDNNNGNGVGGAAYASGQAIDRSVSNGKRSASTRQRKQHTGDPHSSGNSTSTSASITPANRGTARGNTAAAASAATATAAGARVGADHVMIPVPVEAGMESHLSSTAMSSSSAASGVIIATSTGAANGTDAGDARGGRG